MLLFFNSSLKGYQTPYQPSMPMKMSLRVCTQKVGIKFKALLSYESVHGLPPPATSPLTPPAASPLLQPHPSSSLTNAAPTTLDPIQPFGSPCWVPPLALSANSSLCLEHTHPQPHAQSSEQFLPVFQISGKVSSLLKKSPLGVPTR